MRTTYNNESDQRSYAWSQASQRGNYDPRFDDFRPAPHPVPAANSVSISKRTLVTAALATVGAGLAMGVFAFHLTASSPEPARYTVTIPEFASDRSPRPHQRQMWHCHRPVHAMAAWL